MKRIILLTLVVISAIGMRVESGFAQTTQPQQKTIHLFNGQNLDGWYTFLKDRGRNNDPENVFTVQDGVIHISGKEMGSIITNEEYGNYKLLVEYKWDKNDKNLESPSTLKGVARDGGVLLNSVGKDGGYSGIWMHSIEVNIIEGGTGDFIVVGDGTDRFSLTAHVSSEKQGSSYIYQPGSDNQVTIRSGRINWRGRDPNWENVRGFRGKDDVDNPVGEWNKLECFVLGGEISVFLNGILVNKAIDVSPSQGHIQIQSEAAPMFVRRVDLTPLAPHSSVKNSQSQSAGYKQLFNGKNLSGWTNNGTEKWYVENGELICESGPNKKYGYLSTDKSYKNFILDLDFKQEANGNSGVFVRSNITGIGKNGPDIKGWQVEIAPSGLHTGGIYESGAEGGVGGRGWLIQPSPENEKVLKQGEWNHMRIKVVGDEVTSWLNGIEMVHLKDAKFGLGKGFIALQIHAGGGIKVRWKDLRIKEL